MNERVQGWMAGARGVLLLGLLSAVVVLLAHGNNAVGEFYGDDFLHITENPAIAELSQIPRLFVDGKTFRATEQGAHYRPLTMVTLAINRAWSGTEMWSYRWLNDFLHGLNTWLLALVAMALFRAMPGVDRSSAFVAAALVAGLYGAHPIHVETLDYLTSRSNLVCATFFLSTLLVAASWRPSAVRGRWLRAATVGVLCWLTLASKEIGIALLPLLILLDLGVLRRLDAGGPGPEARGMTRQPDFLLHGAVLLATAVFFAVRAWAIAESDQLAANVAPNPIDRSILENLLTQVVVIVDYLRTVFVPSGFCMIRDVEIVRSFASLPFALSLAALLGLGAWALWSWRVHPLISIGLLWAGLVLGPTSSFWRLNAVAADRRMYLALAGLLISLAATALVAGAQADKAPRGQRRPWLKFLTVVLISSVVGLAWASRTRHENWSSRVGIFAESTRNCPDSVEGWGGLAEAHFDLKEFDLAQRAVERSLALAPDAGLPNHIQGNLHTVRRDYAAAAESYLRALDDDSFIVRGETAVKLAEAQVNLGRCDLAQPRLEVIVANQPSDHRARMALGRCEVAAGRLDAGIDRFGQVLDRVPDHIGARVELATALHRQGRMVEAIDHYRRLVESLPGNVGLLVNLGMACGSTGDLGCAQDAFDSALVADPGNESALLRSIDTAIRRGAPISEIQRRLDQARPRCVSANCASALRQLEVKAGAGSGP